MYCVVRSAPPSQFVMSVRSTIVLNVLTHLWDQCCLQGGGGDAVRIFPHFPGRSLSVMFKRKHSSGIVW